MPGPIDCTVVIPVFNRGEALAAGTESLREQTIGADRLEIIYVDDGSNDGYTPAMIDEVVAQTPNARVFHEPASGSPGRPRNVGLANARGEFVFFADHDDWFDRRALERMVGWARQNDSDIVIGKVVAHGRRAVIPLVFRESRTSLPAPQAMISLTPHKLFRRDFLLDHDITTPEGKRRLEDHYFVTHAYLHARTISVYADHVCYHHNHPDDERNFSQTPVDLEVYTRSNGEVIELICRHTDGDERRRDALLARPVLHELLKKASPRRMRPPDAEGEALKHQVLRGALVEAVPESATDRLGAFPRATAKALRNDDPDAVRRIDEHEAALSINAELIELRVNGSTWTIDYRVTLEHEGRPVLFQPASAGDSWQIDEGVLSATDVDRPNRADELLDVDLEILVASRRTAVQWHLPATNSVALERARSINPLRRRASGAMLRMNGTATVDLAKVGGAQIRAGVWDVVFRAEVVGVDLRTRLAVVDESGLPALAQVELPRPHVLASAIVTERARTLAIDVTRVVGEPAT